MADTQVESATSTLYLNQALWGPYYDGISAAAIIYSDSGGDVDAKTTADGGATWATKIEAEAITIKTQAAWPDFQTPGITTDLVHVVYGDFTADTFRYGNVDISGDAWSTPVTIQATAGINTTATNDRSAISKTRSGNLVTCYVTSTASGAYKSTDGGANWSAIANPFAAHAVAHVQGVSVNTGDGNDAGILFWNKAGDELFVSMYDDSLNTWTQSSISGSMVDDSTVKCMDASTFLSNGKVALAAWNATNAATADLKTWILDLNSITSPTITPTTNVVTDSDDSGCVSVFIDQTNDDVYVSFSVGTWSTALTVKYRKSTDDMATWSVANLDYSEDTADDNLSIGNSAMSLAGGRFQPAYGNAALGDILVNLTNDVEIAAVGATATVAATLPSLTSDSTAVQSQIATVTATLPNIETQSTVEQTQTASAVATLPAIAAAITAEHIQTATAAMTLGSLTSDSTGEITQTATVPITLPFLSFASTAAVQGAPLSQSIALDAETAATLSLDVDPDRWR